MRLEVGFPGRVEYGRAVAWQEDRKSTRLNSSHLVISYAVFCLKYKQDQRRVVEDGPEGPRAAYAGRRAVVGQSEHPARRRPPARRRHEPVAPARPVLELLRGHG